MRRSRSFSGPGMFSSVATDSSAASYSQQRSMRTFSSRLRSSRAATPSGPSNRVPGSAQAFFSHSSLSLMADYLSLFACVAGTTDAAGGPATPGLQQHAVQPQVGGIPELPDADGHAVVAVSRLVPIGAEQPVPPGQVEAEIAVGLVPVDRVMNAVHVRRDHEPTKHPVDAPRDREVTVIEHRRGVDRK